MDRASVSYDPGWFRRDIWPKLASVPLKAIVEAIGCSKASGSDIRRGKRSPHVSTWRALAELAGVPVLSRGRRTHKGAAAKPAGTFQRDLNKY